MNRKWSFYSFILIFSWTALIHAVDVGSAAALETGIIDANAGTETVINFLNDIPYTQIFRPLNATSSFAPAGESYTIDGKGFTLSTGGDFRGFFVRGGTGTITIQNITFSGSRAKGGDGFFKAGGGAGMGGALFVGAGATVILEDATFSGCSAAGGDSTGTGISTGGGGGGIFGDGSTAISFGAGGGGGFFGDGGPPNTFAGAGAGGAGSSGTLSAGAAIGGDGGDDFSLTTGGGTGGAPGVSGAAGLSGGGGGGAGFTATPGLLSGGAGGFGGGGGGDSLTGTGGDGGEYGGGGGGGPGFGVAIPGGAGGDGDFGGGGGAGGGGIGGPPPSGGGAGGNGGFGGGGGGGGDGAGSGAGAGGTAGFGGGAGGAGGLGGGGGAGLGGAIFIRAGGELIVQGGISFSGSSAAGGTGANASGSAFGTDIFLMSGGEIEFDITTDSSIPTAIESDMGAGGGSGGGLTKAGSATLTLNGANTYTGTTEIVEGTLLLNSSSVITPVTISGGILAGDGSIIGSDLDNEGGTVSPGMSFGTINVGGDFTELSGGTFLTEVDAVGNADLIAVTGSAMLDGTLTVTAIGSNFIEGTTITILTSGGARTGMFATENIPITSHGTPLFSVNYLSNSVVLTVLDNILFENDCDFKGNEQRVVDYILSLLPIDPDSDLAFEISVIGLLDCADQKKALNSLHPGQYGALEWINLSNSSTVASIFANHARELFCLRCSDHPDGIWLEPFGNWLRQERLTELRGFHTNSAGISLGFDHCFQYFYLGTGASYTHTNLNWAENGGTGLIHTLNAGIYGSFKASIVTIDFSSFIGGNFYDLIRRIDFSAPDPGAFVKVNAKSNHYGVNFTSHLGCTVNFSSLKWPLQARANADYVYLYQNRFHEHGAGSLDLDVRTKTTNMIRTEIGLEVAPTFFYRGGCTMPYIGVSFVSKIPLSHGDFRSNFEGETKNFVVVTNSKAVNQIAPYAGFRMTSQVGFTLNFEGRAELSNLVKNYLASLRLEHRF